MRNCLPKSSIARMLSRITAGIALLAFSLITPAFAQRDLAATNPSTGNGLRNAPYDAEAMNLLPNIPQPCTVMFHGIIPDEANYTGKQLLHVKIYDPSGYLLHDQTIEAKVFGGTYDITLVNVAPAVRTERDQLTLGVVIDSASETRWPVIMKRAREFTTSDVFIAYLDKKRLEADALAQAARNDSIAATTTHEHAQVVDPTTGSVHVKTLSDYAGSEYRAPLAVRMEYSIAAPMGTHYNSQSAMDFGRVSIDLMNLTSIVGAPIGIGARMLHAGNDFRYYSGGIVADVNNDGTVLATIGVAKYQTGSNLATPYIIAPFSRLQYFTSPSGVFLYGEVEATMHLKGYLSGIAGLGLRVFGLELIGGYHYTIFVMPDAESVNALNGITMMANVSF